MDPTAFIVPGVGFVVVVALIWLLGRGQVTRLQQRHVDRALKAEQHSATATIISADGKAAIAWLDDEDRIAVLRRMGVHVGIQVLQPGDISGFRMSGDALDLTIRFRGLGQPSLSFRFTDEKALNRWRSVLMLYSELEAKAA